jgi:hypothetical protein
MGRVLELESERRWQRGFARGLGVLEQMAAEALDEHGQGLTLPLDPHRNTSCIDPGSGRRHRRTWLGEP